MSAAHVTTRILDTVPAPMPIQPAGYSPKMPLGTGIVFLSIAVLFGVVAEPNALGLLLVSFTLGFLLIMIAGVVMQRGLRSGAVRIDANASTLRFEGSRAGTILFVAAAAVALVPGGLVFTTGLAGGSQLASLALIGLSLLALVWLAQLLWSLRVPAGLTLSVSGIRGVRGTKNVDLDWCDLLGASVTFVKDSRLVLSLTTGGTISIVPHYTGSDPNVVAAVLNYYRTHPEHRELLANPRAALDHVERTVAQR